MVKLAETDVREMLERRAAEFAVAAVPPETVLRKAGRRRVRNVVLVSATALLFAGMAALTLFAPSSERGLDPRVGGDPRRGSALPHAANGRLRLVDYVVRAPRGERPHSEAGPKVTVQDLREHAACMRSHGFDVPAPTEQPGGGWAVRLDEPAARAIGLGSRSFREAWFVACGPLGIPRLSGEMVVGGPRAKINRFISCMSSEGFDLPEPRKDTSEGFDIDEWQFDLTQTHIDTSTPEWNRAMFVTCAPDHI